MKAEWNGVVIAESSDIVNVEGRLSERKKLFIKLKILCRYVVVLIRTHFVITPMLDSKINCNIIAKRLTIRIISNLHVHVV